MQFTTCTRNGCTNLANLHLLLVSDASHLDLGELDPCLDDALGDVGGLDTSSSVTLAWLTPTQRQILDPTYLTPTNGQRSELTNL